MGKIINDRWEIVSSLGEGGQGRTFTVREVGGSADSLFVLKQLKNPARVRRLHNEIESISRLSHPATVRLIDSNIDVDRPYLVTEYCAGGNLAVARPFWRDSAVAALTLFEHVLEGIAYAHRQGVVHRDVKPENIFLRTPSGPPVIGDFGLAYLEESDERHTETTEAVGPRLYMAPELEDGRLENVSSAADIYSLGKLLYWLLAGRVFSREKHRQSQWDIKNAYKDPMSEGGDPFLEHINFLLDLMVVEDPTQRRTAENLLILTRQVRHLISTRAHPLTLSIRHPCSFCGRGDYVVRVDGDTLALQNLGIGAVGGNRWRVLSCDRCGHVQLFNTFNSEPWK